MSDWNTCRFCKKSEAGLLKYNVRHYAHPRCYIDAGKSLAELRPWQLKSFPYFLLKEKGLLPAVEKILAGERQ